MMANMLRLVVLAGGWRIWYGVQGFVKVVNECGTRSEKFRMENGLNACARGYKRLKVHSTFIYSCHSFVRLYKLVLGHGRGF